MTKLQQSEHKTLFIEEFYPLVLSWLERDANSAAYVRNPNAAAIASEIWEERTSGRSLRRDFLSAARDGSARAIVVMVAFNQKMVDVHRLRINQSIKGRALLAECLF